MIRFVLILIALVLSASTAWAYPADHPLVTTHKEKSAKHQTKLTMIAQVLHSEDSTQWKQSEVDAYLAEVIWTVYNALNAYMFEHEDLPGSLENLVSAGYLAEWPANPQRNWEPIKVGEAGGEFSAGDLWLATCPIEDYSFKGSYDSYSLVPMSFEMGIFGSSREVPYLAGGAQADNKWAPSAPAGTLYQVGTFSSSARSILEKLEKRAAQTHGTTPSSGGEQK